MILVGQYDSPFVRRVAVTLHHYHMPFDRNTLSVFGDAAKMRKINPLIRIPSLILQSGEVLIDSVAIVDYLDELAGPARALVPPHGPERRKILQAAALAQGAAEKAGQVTYERFFHGPKAINKDWEKRCLSQLSAALKQLESQCGAPWFSDMRMSHADIMTGCMIETSLGISAAAHFAPLLDCADLDGAALLSDDPFTGASIAGGEISIPDAPGLGVERRGGAAKSQAKSQAKGGRKK